MSDFLHELSPSESMYYPSEVRVEDWDQYQERKRAQIINGENFGRQLEARVVSIIKATIEAAVAETTHEKASYRNAGRKKLDDAGIEKSLDKLAQRKAERIADRAFKNEQKSYKKRREEENKIRTRAKASEEAARLERQQRIMNNKAAVIMLEPILSDEVKPATGVPQMEGHQAYRVDRKTCIYVKHGKDPVQAIANYKNKHGLQ